jgi:hypothetical protein
LVDGLKKPNHTNLPPVSKAPGSHHTTPVCAARITDKVSPNQGEKADTPATSPRKNPHANCPMRVLTRLSSPL